MRLIASEDAVIAAALRDAGCIVLGLTNLSVSHLFPFLPPFFFFYFSNSDDEAGVGELQRLQPHIRLVCCWCPGKMDDAPYKPEHTNH